LILLGLATLGLGGCETIAYYGQAAGGHLRLMAAREPVAALIEAADTDPELRRRLRRAAALREFASRELALPDNASYRSYVALGRRYVSWTVVATPELSLEPRRWCFPVAGCVSYRGYFAEVDARRFAARLAADGLDVAVSGVSAYSTLGWFDDPLLDTMLAQPEHRLAAVIFHELAHQRLYVADDSAFNEAFAVAVEREGVRRWLAARAGAEERRRAAEERAARDAFLALVRPARERLAALYRSPASEAAKRAGKARVLAALRAEFERARRRQPALARYRRWFDEGLNNARFALLATYDALLPGLERLLAEQGGDLAAFYRAAAALAALPAAERRARLTAPGR